MIKPTKAAIVAGGLNSSIIVLIMPSFFVVINPSTLDIPD